MSDTFSAQFTNHMLQGAREAGIDVVELMRLQGVDPGLLSDPGARISYRQHTDLVKALHAMLQDEVLGLLDRPVKPNTLKMLTYSAIHAATIGDAIDIWVEGTALLDIGLDVRWQRGAQQSLLVMERQRGNALKNHHAVEYMMFAAHRVFCWFADQILPIAAVELDYPRPEYSEEYRRLFVGAPVSYDCSRNSIAFRQSVLELPNVRDFDQLKAFLREMPFILYSTHYAQQDILSQLRKWLSGFINRREKLPGLDDAAAHFGLHPQALRRELARDGNTYVSVKAGVLQEAAETALQSGGKSVEEIAFDLGFSERGPFIRAFRRWTGMTPLAWRKQVRL